MTSNTVENSPLNLGLTLVCVLQVNSSVLSGPGEGLGSSGPAVKYPGQDGLYTSVGLTQSADVAASVRGEPWCPMALA